MLVVGVVVVALVLGGLALADRLRGGASSPTVLADRVVTAVDHEDLAALVRLVDPGERDALLRVADAWSRHLTDLRLPTAAVGAPADAADALDGLDLSVADVRPTSWSRHGDLAVVGLPGLTVRLRTEPAAAHGLLRAWFGYRRTTAQETTWTAATLPVLGPRPHLVAVERSGRWYLSVLGTLLGPGVADDATLDVRALDPTPSTTPEAAVEATLGVLLDGRAQRDVTTLARTLDPTGADLVQLWASQVATTGLTGGTAQVDALTTAAGPSDGERAVVRVRSLRVGGASPLDVTGACATRDGERACLHPSGYRYQGGTGSLGVFELLGHDGAFSLTAVHDRDGWRTSLPESLADALVGYAGGLTRQQVLMVLGEERLDRPDGGLEPDRSEVARFTDGGYALRTLHIARAGLYRVLPGPDGGNRASIYDADGQPSIQPFYPNDSVYRLAAGDHTLLVWADDAFAATLADDRAEPYVQELEVRSVG